MELISEFPLVLDDYLFNRLYMFNKYLFIDVLMLREFSQTSIFSDSFLIWCTI
jgi:hypothetical protein